MDKKRPVNLDLTKFHFPPMAIISILHRISGVFLFLGLPLVLYLLFRSLGSPDTFNEAANLVATPWMRFLLWVVLSATLFHLVAGIRHIVMDFGLADSLRGGRIGAYAVFVIAIILIVLAGVWLW